MSTTLHLRRAALSAAILVAAFALAACEGNSSPSDSGEGDAATATMDLGDGRRYTVTSPGAASAGDTITVGVEVLNGSSSAWADGYCVLIVDDVRAAYDLTERTFDVAPEEGVADSLRFTLPDDLPAASYGVAIIVPGDSSMATVLRVGDPEPTSGGWNVPSACIAGERGSLEVEVERTPFTLDDTGQPVREA